MLFSAGEFIAVPAYPLALLSVRQRVRKKSVFILLSATHQLVINRLVLQPSGWEEGTITSCIGVSSLLFSLCFWTVLGRARFTKTIYIQLRAPSASRSWGVPLHCFALPPSKTVKACHLKQKCTHTHTYITSSHPSLRPS